MHSLTKKGLTDIFGGLTKKLKNACKVKQNQAGIKHILYNYPPLPKRILQLKYLPECKITFTTRKGLHTVTDFCLEQHQYDNNYIQFGSEYSLHTPLVIVTTIGSFTGY